jgi:hypothetical protein
MVSERDVAWHAGNGWVNAHSVGIENEGYTFVPWTFTDAEYRASSRLVASLLRHYVLPIDRRHVIGHAEVRDPVRPWLSGGSSHHTDPGPYWDWPRFMSYVRSYARGRTPPPPALDVTTNLRLLQRLTGTVRWEGLVSGLPVARVQFLVDGRLRETVGHPPYAFSNGAWNTTWERNGRHVVTVHAVAADGRSADASSVVTIKNQPPRVSGINLADGQTVSGLVRVEATVSRPPQRVELLVDGAVRGSSTTPPYGFDWDTTQEVPGVRMLTVRAVVRGYAVSALSVFVVVVPPAP